MASERRKMPRWRGRPLIAKITFGFVILGFAALAARVAVTLANPVDPLDQKIAAAQRYLYYQFTPSSGPSFVLTGAEGEIHLVSHVVMPPADVYDPMGELEYGAHVEVDLRDGTTWTREIFTRTRQSKARPQNEGKQDKRTLWLDENTFSLERDIEISDDRVLIFQLPTNVAVGGHMRVRLVGDAREGFLRAYTPIPRPDTERHVRELPGADRKRIAEGTSYVPWDRLTKPYELASMRFAPHRLSAEGKEGLDYETHTLYTTNFRLPYALVTQRGTPVAPDRAIAINVVGPARVDVMTNKPIGGRDGTVSVQLVGENMPVPGQPAPAPIAIPLGSSGPISVPAGVFTLAISSNAQALVELTAPPATPITLGRIANAPLVPDEQLLPMYRAGPDAPKLVLATDGPDDLLGRVIRVDVRALATAPCVDVTSALKRWPDDKIAPTPARGVLPKAPPCTRAAPPADLVDSNLTIEALDTNGKTMSTSTAKIESAPSKFETVKLYNHLTASVCEPISIRFIVPPGGKAVRLSVDKPALLSASTPVTLSPPADTVDAPYDSLTPQVTTMWRYARYKERGWLPIRAHDQWPAEWIGALDVQARLETKIIPPAPEITSTSLSPAGRLEQQTVVELVPGDDTALFLQRWGDGHYTRLVPGKASKLDLGRLPSRPSIMYFAGDEQVGSPANVTIDSQLVEGKLSASRGSLKLPAGLAGTHAVTVDAPDKTRLLIDRPPAAGTRGELYAVRTVYRLGGGKSARLVVAKRTALPQNVDIVLYARSGAADPNAQIRIVIDGGHPARRAGTAITRYTLADRTLPLPPSDRPATLGFANASSDALAPRLIAIALGDDLPPGTHTVEVSVTAGPPMWARLFTFDGVPPAPRALQWRMQADVGESN